MGEGNPLAPAPSPVLCATAPPPPPSLPSGRLCHGIARARAQQHMRLMLVSGQQKTRGAFLPTK